MDRLKQILKKLFCLPPLPTILIAVPSFAFVFAMLGTKNSSPFAYVSYILSAYAAILTVAGTVRIIRAAKQNQIPLLKKIRKAPLGSRLLEDAVFRLKITLHADLAVNSLYAVLNLYSGVRSRSAWFIALAFYYILLSVMQGRLVKQLHRTPVGKNRRAELQSYRFCGIALLLMNQILAGIVFYIVKQNQSFTYSGFMIYVMAAYTFYITISAIVNAVKFRKRGSPLLSAAKMISLMAALVSMLALETAMISQFGGGRQFQRTMTGAFGGAVCAFVLGMAVAMIVGSSRELRKLRFHPSET